MTWDEITKWYHHPPNFSKDERPSAFTPENTWSAILGTMIGKRIVMRMLSTGKVYSYKDIATEEIQKVISDLEPVASIAETKIAYDLVDRKTQLNIPEEERNKDVWWDSGNAKHDQRNVFKRNINTGPVMIPWLIPKADKTGCAADAKARVITVPFQTSSGKPLDDFYEFRITPDRELSYRNFSKKQIHKPLRTFATIDIKKIIRLMSTEMEEVLLRGFDRRDSQDPIQHLKKTKKMQGVLLSDGKKGE